MEEQVQKKKILITGFGPFKKHEVNPSEYLANKLYDLLKEESECDEPKIINFTDKKDINKPKSIWEVKSDKKHVHDAILNGDYDYIISFGLDENNINGKCVLEYSANPLLILGKHSFLKDENWRKGNYLRHRIIEIATPCTRLNHFLKSKYKGKEYKYSFIHLPIFQGEDNLNYSEYDKIANQIANYIKNLQNKHYKPINQCND